MHKRSKPLFLLLICCIFIQYGYSQLPYVKLSTRLERIAYLIDGISPHFDYYPPGYAAKGKFVLEYWFKPGETIPTEAEARAILQAFEQIVILYGYADSAKYFDTSFIKLVPASRQLPYSSKWAYTLATQKLISATEDDRFHALLNIVPFDHSEYFTSDTAFVRLYQTRNVSPTSNLECYSAILALVIQSFVFDRPRRSICVSFFDDKKNYTNTYCADFSNPSLKFPPCKEDFY